MTAANTVLNPFSAGTSRARAVADPLDPVLLGELLEAVPDAIVVVDETGRIVLANAGTETLFGYSRAELDGRGVEMLLPEALQERHGRHRSNYLANPRPRAMGAGMYLAGRRKDGTEFNVEISLSPLHTARGTLVSAAIREMTAREMEETHEAMVNILEDFSADKARLDGNQAAILNILDDFSDDKSRLESSQAAILNILEDFDGEKKKVETINQDLRREIVERREAEQLLKDTVAEREVLLKEVHHRVKNNLQVVSSLFSLQGRYVRDEESRAMFRESQNRVLAIALVHEKLYQSEDLSQIDFGDYTRNLVGSLLDASQVTGKISVHLDVEEVKLPVNEAIPCGLIINELVMNSIKHAFPDGSGTIGVGLQADSARRELTVRDDGIGLPLELDVEHTGSLGLQLVFTLARQLDADLSIQRQPGTTFRLAFKGAN